MKNCELSKNIKIVQKINLFRKNEKKLKQNRNNQTRNGPQTSPMNYHEPIFSWKKFNLGKKMKKGCVRDESDAV